MSTVVLTAGVKLSVLADDVLRAAGRLWFGVAVAGQLMLAAYVTWFYGSTAVQGRAEQWNQVLTRGHARGDAMGNTALVVHLVAAVILVVGGAMQFIPQLRERFPRFHRLTGRVYVTTAVATALAGLYLTWIRGTRGDLPQFIGGTMNAILIIVCACSALRSALTGRFAAHRHWVLRLFMVVSGAWFYRVGLFLWVLLNQGPAGFDPASFRGPALTFISFANSLLPLTVLELYLSAQSRAGTAGRLVTAAAVFVLTVAMGVGIFAAATGMWLPIIRTGRPDF
jgi:uncharacterized membrane protein